MVRVVTTPSFSGERELARFVHEVNRLSGNRTAAAEFIESVPPLKERPKEYFSVNSLEVETLRTIADYYQDRFAKSTADIAICSTKVNDFNDAGKKSGVLLQYDKPTSSWQFVRPDGTREPAYKHRPNRSSDDLKSESHCGVEFLRVLDENARAKFARRLGGRRFHLLRRRNDGRR
jgi:hypothetical protein